MNLFGFGVGFIMHGLMESRECSFFPEFTILTEKTPNQLFLTLLIELKRYFK
jgi:hypothetical protein